MHVCPTKKKHSMCISKYMQTTFFYLGKFLKKSTDDQCSPRTKDSIYHIKHMSIQPFTMGVDWPEIGRLVEVSIMLDICTYWVLLCTANVVAYATIWHSEFYNSLTNTTLKPIENMKFDLCMYQNYVVTGHKVSS